MAGSEIKNISILSFQECTGCLSCFLVCPKNCIAVQENKEGFLYPSVDGNRCIQCGSCIKHCPILNPMIFDHIKSERYALVLKDKVSLSKSSSGGLFAGVASYFLENDGAVFGASYDEELNVHQIKIESKAELYKIQGSKYVSSCTEETFREVKSLLSDGRKILYSGSPCQVAGLRSYLGKPYNNLFMMDLICHGVPSQKLLKKYLEWLGNKNHGRVIYYGFRDKDVSGWSCGGKVKIKTKTKTKTKILEGFCDPYYHSFLICESYRESCYVCPFANTDCRTGDITMGDFWGTDELYPEIPAKDGISFGSVNTMQGRKLFELVRDRFWVYECPEKETLKVNVAYHHPSVRPSSRDSVYKGIDGDLNSYFKSFKRPSYLKFRIRNILLKLTPQTVKKIAKKILGRV